MLKNYVVAFLFVLFALGSLQAETIGIKASPNGKVLGYLARNTSSPGEGQNYAFQFWTSSPNSSHKVQRTKLWANCLNGPAGVVAFEFSPSGSKVALVYRWKGTPVEEFNTDSILVLNLITGELFSAARGGVKGGYKKPYWISEQTLAAIRTDTNGQPLGLVKFFVKKLPLYKD